MILAVPPEEAARLLRDQPLDVPLTRIGTFTAEPGLWIEDPQAAPAVAAARVPTLARRASEVPKPLARGREARLFRKAGF